MGHLISCHALEKTFGAKPLFSGLSFHINEGERIGLIGPNGAGKSTLLRILAGLDRADAGERTCRKDLRIAYVPQVVDLDPAQSAREVLERALADLPSAGAESDHRVQSALFRLGLTDPDQKVSSLSGGLKKRLSIACALVCEPELLCLDEPTNHLDLEGMAFLEELLLSNRFACVVVSHDRAFLQAVATSVAELNRVYPGGLFRVEGGYRDFLEKREDFLAAQSAREEALSNRVRREIDWLKRGPKARTTKAEGRIQEAHRLMEELSDLRTRSHKESTSIAFTASGRKTKRLLWASGLSKTLGGKKLFSDLDLLLSPGRKLGILGENGSGKTTLLRLLKGELSPDEGSIERVEHLQVVSFDQHREELDPTISLKRALAPEGDTVLYRGRSVHVAGWARRFQFRTDALELPVGSLSGGEKAKVLIARLMTRQADVLLLDEPTNDLDIPTLEILEESLAEFEGALVLVTHDRYMLDRICTVMVGILGDGHSEVFADLAQWEEAKREKAKKTREEEKSTRKPAPERVRKPGLSYLEKREFEAMEETILSAEADLARAEEALRDPAIASDAALLQGCYLEAGRARVRVDQLYERWSELAAKKEGGS